MLSASTMKAYTIAADAPRVRGVTLADLVALFWQSPCCLDVTVAPSSTCSLVKDVKQPGKPIALPCMESSSDTVGPLSRASFEFYNISLPHNLLVRQIENKGSFEEASELGYHLVLVDACQHGMTATQSSQSLLWRMRLPAFSSRHMFISPHSSCRQVCALSSHHVRLQFSIWQE